MTTITQLEARVQQLEDEIAHRLDRRLVDLSVAIEKAVQRTLDEAARPPVVSGNPPPVASVELSDWFAARAGMAPPRGFQPWVKG